MLFVQTTYLDVTQDETQVHIQVPEKWCETKMAYLIFKEGGIYNFQWQSEIFVRLHLTHLGRSSKVKLF